MKQFAYLLRKRSRALGLFARVANRLRRLEMQIEKLMGEKAKEIDSLKSQISEHTQAHCFLHNELRNTRVHRENIEQFVPSENPPSEG